MTNTLGNVYNVYLVISYLEKKLFILEHFSGIFKHTLKYTLFKYISYILIHKYLKAFDTMTIDQISI